MVPECGESARDLEVSMPVSARPHRLSSGPRTGWVASAGGPVARSTVPVPAERRQSARLPTYPRRKRAAQGRCSREACYDPLYAKRNAYYPCRVIKSFANKATAALFAGRRVRSFPPDIHRRVYAKLQALDAADTLDFLRVPPSNRLEQLRGNRKGQWSIRINEQWRICFRWEDRDAYDVEVTDYH